MYKYPKTIDQLISDCLEVQLYANKPCTDFIAFILLYIKYVSKVMSVYILMIFEM